MVPGTMLGAFTCSMSPKAQNKPVFNGGYFSIYTRVKPGSKKMHEDWPRSHGQEEAEAAMGAQSHALSIVLHGMGQESIKHRGQAAPRSTCDAGVIHPLLDNLQMLISYPTHNPRTHRAWRCSGVHFLCAPLCHLYLPDSAGGSIPLPHQLRAP